MAVDRISELTGEVLRRARKARGLTLHEVRRRSKGRFKPSTVGGYERGERIISITRFCELANMYGVPADRLLGEVLEALSPQARREIVLEPERLSNIEDEIRLPVEQFVERVAEERGDHAAKVMTLRSGDLETLAFESGLAPRTLLDRLAPALHR
jgi:transcriptional regulator with XRE-family HTH domain